MKVHAASAATRSSLIVPWTRGGAWSCQDMTTADGRPLLGVTRVMKTERKEENWCESFDRRTSYIAAFAAGRRSKLVGNDDREPVMRFGGLRWPLRRAVAAATHGWGR